MDKVQTQLSRRKFMGKSFAAFAAMGIPGLYASESGGAIELAPKDRQPPKLDIPEAPARKTGWAIAGLGELAVSEILPAFSQCRLAKPVALVSGHADKARKLAEYYGMSSDRIYDYQNYEKMKEIDEIEAVYIVLPNSLHAEYTIRALNIGKHVLCEKPLAPSVRECEQMIAAAKSNSRKLMTAYRLRYEPFNKKMIEIAREGTFGKIRAIEGVNLQNVQAPNIRLSSELKGGPLGDVGIYCINAFRYITGEDPLEVNAMLTRPSDDPRFAEVEDRIAFQMRFPSGILANGLAGFSAHQSRRYRVHAEQGWFELDPAFSYFGLKARVSSKSGIEELQIKPVNHFAAEMDHFSECIQANKDPLTPGEDGLEDIRVIEAINQAAASGSTVTIERPST